jgi:hypothetical protein
MTGLQLDERISQLAGKEEADQVSLGLSIILESPNGEAPYVFDAISVSAAKQLGRQVDRVYGLLTAGYLQERVNTKTLVADLTFDNAHQLSSLTYVLFDNADMAGIKEHLKTNDVVQTNVIGVVKGKVGALLSCDVNTASKIAGSYGLVGIAHYSHGDRFEDLQRKAADDLAAGIRLNIAAGIKDGSDVDKLLSAYFELKKDYKF